MVKKCSICGVSLLFRRNQIVVHQNVFPLSTCNDGTASPVLTLWTHIPEGEDSGGVGTYLVPQVAWQYHALTGCQDKFAPVDVVPEPSINVWSLVDLQTVSLLCVICTLGCGGAFAQESKEWAQAYSIDRCSQILAPSRDNHCFSRQVVAMLT